MNAGHPARDGESAGFGSSGRSIAAATLATAAGGMPVFLLGGVAVQVRGELGFTESGLGLIVSTFFALSAVTSVLAGRVTERLGSQRTMIVVGVIAAGSLSAVGLASSWWGLVFAVAVGACANSLAQPASNLLLARAIDPRRQGFAFGLKQAAIPSSSLLGGLAVPLFALTVGWRWAFVAGALTALLILPLAPPERAPARSHGRVRPRSRLQEGAHGPLLILACAAFFGNFGSNALAVFLVESLVSRGYAEAFAGTTLMMGSAVGVAARLGLGLWADRTRANLFQAAGVMLLAGASGHLLLATGHPLAVAPAILLTFGAGWGWNGLFSYSVVNANRETPAAATGVTQSGLFAGAMAGPGVFGAVAERASFGAAWGMLAVSMALASALMYLGARRLSLRGD